MGQNTSATDTEYLHWRLTECAPDSVAKLSVQIATPAEEVACTCTGTGGISMRRNPDDVGEVGAAL